MRASRPRSQDTLILAAHAALTRAHQEHVQALQEAQSAFDSFNLSLQQTALELATGSPHAAEVDRPLISTTSPKSIDFGYKSEEPIAPAFPKTAIDAFRHGDPVACFGEELADAICHTRTPRLYAPESHALAQVLSIDPQGGNHRLGSIAIEIAANQDPETAALQALSLYLAYQKETIRRDGWLFEKLLERDSDTQSIKGRDRSPSGPQSTDTTKGSCNADRSAIGPYQNESASLPRSENPQQAHIHITSLYKDEDQPCITARVSVPQVGIDFPTGLKLAVAYPLTSFPELVSNLPDTRPVASLQGLTFDQASTIACSLGEPAKAFGPAFIHFKNGRSPRLPSPPYNCCTRITKLDANFASMETGSSVEFLFDIASDPWYFQENDQTTMPIAILLEAALQPCGWLSTFLLEKEAATWEPLFRNLDGNCRFPRPVTPNDETIVTRITQSMIAKVSEQVIVKCEIECRSKGEIVMQGDSTFGFFTQAALDKQGGFPPSGKEIEILNAPGKVDYLLADRESDLRQRFGYKLPVDKLRRIHRITDFDTKGGKFGKGYMRGENPVSRADWVFKAHFYRDPVQPGSIGIEALCQLLKLYALELSPPQTGSAPVFETPLPDLEVKWAYRGQVLPHNKMAVFEAHIESVEQSERGLAVIAEGSLWADGVKLYSVNNLSLRLRFEALPDEKRRKAFARQHGLSEAGLRWQPILRQWDNLPFNPTAKGQTQSLDADALRRAMNRRFGYKTSALRDVMTGLIARFVDAVIIESPEAFERTKGKPALYLANHQIGIESVLFNIFASILGKTDCRIISKEEHRQSTFGALNKLIESEIGFDSLFYFDRANQQAMFDILDTYKIETSTRPYSLFAHASGTRSLQKLNPLKTVSSALTDLAIKRKLPIIPVRFGHGLPSKPVPQRLEFPYQYGKQRYYVGTPIASDELAKLNLKQRAERICAAVNELGPKPAKESLIPTEQPFRKTVERIRETLNLAELPTTFIATLFAYDQPCDESKKLISWMQSGMPKKRFAEFNPETQSLIKLLSLTANGRYCTRIQ